MSDNGQTAFQAVCPFCATDGSSVFKKKKFNRVNRDDRVNADSPS